MLAGSLPHHRATLLPRTAGVALGAGLVAAVLGVALTEPSLARLTIAVVLTFGLGATSLRSPRLGVLALAAWLPLQGLARRLTFDLGPDIAIGDPLLLVTPAVLLILVASAWATGAFRKRTSLASAVLAFQAVLVCSALNPLQGGIAVGLGGLLFIVVPSLGFWVGSAVLTEPDLRRMMKVLVGGATLAALYALVQSFGSLPVWDQRWADAKIRDGTYTALLVGGSIRAFGPFTAASDLVNWLVIAFAATFGMVRRLGSSLPVLGILGLLGWVIYLNGSRGAVVALVAVVVVTVARACSVRPRTAILLVALSFLAIPVVILRIAPATFSDDLAGSSYERQADGLTDPFGKASTLPGHIDRLVAGVLTPFKNPVGIGIGAISVSSSSFGGTNGGTEVDLANAAVSAGVLGLAAYVLMMTRYLRAAWQLDSRLAIGLTIAVAGGLLNSGNYAVIVVSWLIVGAIDRMGRQDASTSTATPNGERSPASMADAV